jgi:hypothetical protein
MAELTDALTQLLGGQTDQIGRRIGADPQGTRSALDAAVPALLAAFGSEAERGSGLRHAIEQDHDGSILDQLSAYLDGSAQLSPRTTNGAGILNHVLGDRQEDMARAISAKSGLDLGTIMQLLPLLAPILMGMLGKRSRSGAGGGSGGGGTGFDQIGDALRREREDTRSRNPDIGDILDSFAKGGSSSRTTSSSSRTTTSTGRARAGGGFADFLDRLLGRKR